MATTSEFAWWQVQSLHGDYFRICMVARSEHRGRQLKKIQRRLGGVLFKKIHALVDDAFSTNSLEKHEDWVHDLLYYYYDPMYNHKLNLRKNYIVHRGNFESCFDYISSIK